MRKASDSDFDVIDDLPEISILAQALEDARREFPWLDPHHPLYFPETQSDVDASGRYVAMKRFAVENWCYELGSLTFESHIVTLDQDAIRFLIGKLPTFDSSSLIHRLNDILLHFNSGAFFRLSLRSPKDSARLFKKAIDRMVGDTVHWPQTRNKNQRLVSCVDAMREAMKVENAAEILEIITRSPRVFNDLCAILSHQDASERTTNIVLRKWFTIRPDHEFRVFVSRRCRSSSIVTAISSYFHFLFFDAAPIDCFNFLDEAAKNEIILKLQSYVTEQVDPIAARILKFSSDQDKDNSPGCIREYIIDLALISSDQCADEMSHENEIVIWGKSYVIKVIELNPFAPAATGSALFNWKSDLDLLQGKAAVTYPVFRWRAEPRSIESLSSITLLPKNYHKIIKKAALRRWKKLNAERDLLSARQLVAQTCVGGLLNHLDLSPDAAADQASNSVCAHSAATI